MTYLYTQEDRLKFPHGYMYTPFGGSKFLDDYINNRLNVINRIDGCNYLRTDSEISLCQMLIKSVSDDICDRRISDEGRINCDQISEQINTNKLLKEIIEKQISGNYGGNVVLWLDKLVQRFEATKRLYDYYPPGFRKGYGEYQRIEQYWLMALALCLYYEKFKKIKYLSTQLKLTDLLCSQSTNQLNVGVPLRGFSLLIKLEVTYVRNLINQAGVKIVS